MRRGSWLVVIAISLAACGIDVIGVSPADTTPLTEAGTTTSSSGGSGSTTSSSGSTTEPDATTDGPASKPVFDAGAAEVVLDNVQNLTSIVIAGNRLVVGRSNAEALTLDLGPGAKAGTIPKVQNARALVASGTDVFFVGQVDTDSGNIGHWNADGSNDGDTHSNEPPGRDLCLEGILAFGSYKDHVVSYVAKDFSSVQNRSDTNGTPRGVVATASDVYWADDARGTVFKDSRTVSGTPTVVKDGLVHPSSLTLVGLLVYVATSTDITKVSPTLETVASGLSKPMALTHDVTTLYWIDAGGGFLKRQVPGASVETIGTLTPFEEFRPKLIDFKDENVYWGSPNEGRVYRRRK